MDRRGPFLLDETVGFPPAELAAEGGLLAVGGALTTEWLVEAYRSGIFPWPWGEDEPMLWWCPDPRLVLYPGELTVSRSLRQRVRSGRFDVRYDTAFREVMEACAAVSRRDEPGTWITAAMIDAYTRLFELGIAHSAEAWRDGRLVGGLYGLRLGRAFFGESMFHIESDASKVAFVELVRRLESEGCDLIDCQMETDHLLRFGARPIPRARFLGEISAAQG